MSFELTHFQPDPAFGTGIYRRRLRFAAEEHAVAAQVDDTHHAFWLLLTHDGRSVTAIEAGFLRAPTTVCGGATAGLQGLIGASLGGPVQDVMARLPVLSNCTHLTDLALWAMAHIGRSAVWDIEVPDQRDTPVWIAIQRNGHSLHRWRIADHAIVAPEALRERPMMRGFARWARETFAGDALLAATMLQRGVFVARGRAYVVDRAPATPLRDAAGMEGMCWSYSGERYASAAGALGFVRDFTHGIATEPAPAPVARLLQKLER